MMKRRTILNDKPFILTFGSCGWDRIVYKNADGSRELIYEEEGRKNSHQAVAARKAGADSTLISFVGDDEIGKKVLASLDHFGIDTKYVTVVKGAATEINTQILDRITRDYELERGPAELSYRYTPAMAGQYSKEILRADFVILVSKQPKDFLTEVINLCHANGIKTALTVSHRNFDIKNTRDLETLKKCTVIAGNLKESEDLTGRTSQKEMLRLLPNLMITNAEGVWFCDEIGNICHEKSVPAKDIVETNGAGDTFIGNFIVFRAESKPIRECVRLGQCAAAIEIGKMGVINSMPYRDETIRLYEKHFGKVR